MLTIAACPNCRGTGATNCDRCREDLLELGAAAFELLAASPERRHGRHAAHAMNARGYVEPRGRGWWLRLPYRDTAGVRRQRRDFLGTYSDIRSAAAARARADALLARSRAEPVKPGPVALTAEVLERFLRLCAPGLRQSSLTRYTRLLRRLAIPALGSVPVAQIDTARVRELFADLAQRGVARSTLIGLRVVLLRALEEARADGFPVRAIEAKRLKISLGASCAREIIPITAAELKRLLEATSGADRVLYGLMGYSGLRISEAFGLRWVDVDYKAHTLSVAQAVVAGRIQKPKTAGSIAVLPMLPALEELLRQYQRFGPSNYHGLVFTTRAGTPQLADNFRARRWYPLLKRLGLPQRGLHAFRHGLPRILFDAGVSADVIRRLLRHSSLAMTLRYSHSDAQDLRDGLDAAAARITSATTHSRT
jgi:integrase